MFSFQSSSASLTNGKIRPEILELNRFDWLTSMARANTTGAGKGNYRISAHAEPVPGETNTTDNNLTNATAIMLVGLPGDGVSPFGVVDMRDVSFVARRLMCSLGDPLWDQVADINGDGRVDMKDVSIVAKAFWQH